MNQLLEKFNALPERDQRALKICGVFLGCYLFFGVFYGGLIDSRDKYQDLVSQSKSTLAQVQGYVAQIKSLKSQGKTASIAGSDQSFSQLANGAAKLAGTRVSQFQPSGDNAAQVFLDSVSFSQFVDFSTRLEVDYGLSITEVVINQAGSAGLINAKIRFGR